MKIEAKELMTKETDDRGRVYLGTDKANRKVTIAVLEVEAVEE